MRAGMTSGPPAASIRAIRFRSFVRSTRSMRSSNSSKSVRRGGPVTANGDGDLECYGVGNVTKNGQITVPADARTEIGIEPNGRVIFFGDRRSGRLIVTSAPPAG